MISTRYTLAEIISAVLRLHVLPLIACMSTRYKYTCAEIKNETSADSSRQQPGALGLVLGCLGFGHLLAFIAIQVLGMCEDASE